MKGACVTVIEDRFLLHFSLSMLCSLRTEAGNIHPHPIAWSALDGNRMEVRNITLGEGYAMTWDGIEATTREGGGEGQPLGSRTPPPPGSAPKPSSLS